jgi:hypothetical protein
MSLKQHANRALACLLRRVPNAGAQMPAIGCFEGKRAQRAHAFSLVKVKQRAKRFPFASHKYSTVANAAFCTICVFSERKQTSVWGVRSGKKGLGMASIDIQEPLWLRTDTLGLSLFIFHLGVGFYFLTGWAFPYATALSIYLILLPAVVTQWLFNRGSCIINNFESWLRTGRWRSTSNLQEGHFLQLLIYWFAGLRPDSARTNVFCYVVMAGLWLLALGHLLLLSADDFNQLAAVAGVELYAPVANPQRAL